MKKPRKNSLFKSSTDAKLNLKDISQIVSKSNANTKIKEKRNRVSSAAVSRNHSIINNSEIMKDLRSSSSSEVTTKLLAHKSKSVKSDPASPHNCNDLIEIKESKRRRIIKLKKNLPKSKNKSRKKKSLARKKQIKSNKLLKIAYKT